ncbi:hypothetical protein SAMN04490357_0303 [Streptomyces misionensis]|uniref:Uncharacterized protein n=1 Tax=Streptomyces misionensis TaxID=67331 RepID=A0A1H4LX12_9ACTN|nr:hypothetical protein SAMN04490357_0303 [Streptomyces misionensis]
MEQTAAVRLPSGPGGGPVEIVPKRGQAGRVSRPGTDTTYGRQTVPVRPGG